MVKLGHMTNPRHTTGVVPELTTGMRCMIARLHAGLEQADLAALTGLSRNTISNYEKDKVSPRRAGLISIAFATGVDLGWLETGETPTDPGTSGGKVWGHRGSNPGPMDYGLKNPRRGVRGVA